MSDEARACIVFEEAHSLISRVERGSVRGRQDCDQRHRESNIARSKVRSRVHCHNPENCKCYKKHLKPMQYGLRLRVFDATGMELLKNYIGEDYASVLSSLEDRHAVAFGRGSLCRNPVLLRFNDRDEFIATFRAPAHAIGA